MADVFDAATRSRIMSKVRSRGNKATELALVALFREHGVTGWRRHAALPGSPDFSFAKERIAVFVHGCFWHGCPKHGRVPASNRRYWAAKIERNTRRDAAARRALRARGWTVVQVWEHELKKRPQAAVRRIMRALARE